jgi:hypothetical protein
LLGRRHPPQLHLRCLLELRARLAEIEEHLRRESNAVANSAAGNCWMPVLYCGTELLKKRRAKTVEI